MRYLIFGVDPGTTTAVAALDLDGAVVAATSVRHMGLNGVVEYMTSLGHPALIAADVNPPPEFVLKLASSFGSPLHVPRKSLKVEEKIELTRGIDFDDAHQRDALAAALNALAHYQNKFRKIDARKLGVDAKKRSLSGEKITQENKDKPEPKKPRRRGCVDEATVGGLRRKISKLEEQAALKDRKIRLLEKRIVDGEVKTRSAYDERARERSTDLSIKTLKKRIRALESELVEYERLSSTIEKVALGEIKPVGVYPQIYGGLTLARGKLRGDDLEVISKSKFVFTQAEQNKNVLHAKRIVVLNPSVLTEVCGKYFVDVRELTKPRKEKEVNLGELVLDYRGRR